MAELKLWLYLLISRWQSWVSGSGVAGLSVIILYFIERWRGWTMNKLWYFLIFVVLFILGASFSVWKDQYKKTNELQSKLTALTISNFKVHYLGAIFGEIPPGGSQIILIMRVDNLGSDSPVPENTWVMSAINKGRTFNGRAYMLNPGNNDSLLHDPNGAIIGIRRFVPEDALYEKLSHPLKTNEYKIGVLKFIFPDMPVSILRQEDTIVRLQFGDIRNNQSVDWKMSYKEMGMNKGLIYLPGLKYPTILDQTDQ